VCHLGNGIISWLVALPQQSNVITDLPGGSGSGCCCCAHKPANHSIIDAANAMQLDRSSAPSSSSTSRDSHETSSLKTISQKFIIIPRNTAF